MPSSPSPRFLVALAFLGSVAGAQGQGILGKDNGDFARRLFEDGYPDLAENLCRAITASSPPPTEELAVQALGFELDLARAKRELDFQKRRDALSGIIEKENAFLKEYARTRVAEDVRANLPNVYIELATTLTATMAMEQDPVRRAELTSEAQRVFEEAKDNLRKRRDNFATRLREEGGSSNYNERQHQVASFNLARMDYQHALLFAEGLPERKDLLKAALKEFKDFGYDYPETIQNFQGIIFQGLCHEGLGALADALVDYQDAIELRELFEPDEKGAYQVGPDEADVVSGATLRLVKLLTRMKREREAIAAADDYNRRIPGAALANSGPEVLAAKAEAEIAAGDVAGASATAQQLVDLDPSGWSGRTGREILGRLPIFGLAPDKILKIAETSAGRGDYWRALDLCRQAREIVRGARDEQDIGSASFTLAGFVYRSLGRQQEASLAYDCAATLYPKGKSAPEALYLGVNAYRELAKKERSRFYSTRADERMKTLATQYAGHPRAASAGIYQGQRREDEGDFVGARDFYSKVPKDSGSYHEALFRLANATNLQGKSLLEQDKRAEAMPLFDTADREYQTAMDTLKAAQEGTLDPAVQQRLANFLVSCRLGLASLYLDTGKPQKVQGILAGLEQKVADPDVVANIWALRITALQAEGKVDEAVALFESVILGTNSSGTASAAGVLARALDQSAQDLAAKQPDSKRAVELWRKAANYYLLSVKGALDGSAVLRPEEVKQIGQRLYVLGLHFNDVPEGQLTFVDWQGTVKEPELWEQAALLYERLDAQAPSSQVSIERARTLAILGRVQEAEPIYARLFDQVSLFTDATSDRFDRSVIESRPELISAYLEWAAVSHRVGIASKDEALLTRAETIYKRMIGNTTDSSRLWWQTRFSQILLLSDRGQYDFAQTALANVKRNTDPEFDKGRFGFKEKFEALEAEVSKKVFRK